MRKAPTGRVASRAGVAAYEAVQIDELAVLPSEAAGTVRLALRQSIGAPSHPVVKDGERVEEGRLIAVCPAGSLGSALHDSVSGVVKVEEQYLEIKASGSGGTGDCVTGD